MSKELRWRIITLQGVLVVVLAFGAGFLFWANSFTTSMVRDQLGAQQIYFPGHDQIKAGGALDPAEFPHEIRDQAGNQVTTGDQARIYANDFIGVHLQKVANGKTYAQVSAAAIAATDPTQKATLNAQKTTLFQGETLRGLLLQAYAWWTVGLYALYAAIGLAVATLAVFGAFVFELLIAPRIEKPTIRTLKDVKAA